MQSLTRSLSARSILVFFGSALTNFGGDFSAALPHDDDAAASAYGRLRGVIDPVKEDFSAFVFKIQANMNKAHRDRIAFMRICPAGSTGIGPW